MLLPSGLRGLVRSVCLNEKMPIVVQFRRLLCRPPIEQIKNGLAEISHMNRHLIPHRLVEGITREHEWGFTTFRLPDETSRTR